jgi:hypothetical protein
MSTLFLVGCKNGDTSSKSIQLSIDHGMAIPGGYNFIGASSWGAYYEVSTLYIQNKENERIYEYDGERIGTEIIIPDGYSFVAVSAWGGYVGCRTFYCKNNKTNEVFKFQIK